MRAGTLVAALVLLATAAVAGAEENPEKKAPERFIAPLFKFGPGYSTYGALSMSQPAFLASADAVDLIKREFVSHDLVFTRTNKTIAGNGLDFTLDGFDQRRNIGFKFLSLEDYTAFANRYNETRRDSPYQPKQDTFVIDFLMMGEELRKAAKEAGEVNFVVFYDPCGNTSDDSLEWLSQQVAAFVKWGRAKKHLEPEQTP